MPRTENCQLGSSRGGKQLARCFRDNPCGRQNICQLSRPMNKQELAGHHAAVYELVGPLHHTCQRVGHEIRQRCTRK